MGYHGLPMGYPVDHPIKRLKIKIYSKFKMNN